MLDKQYLAEEIVRFVSESRENGIPGYEDARLFDEPVVGFADASDPIFDRYKKIIGSFHITPFEWLQKTFPGESFNQATVVSWILPISEDTRRENRAQTKYPSKRWALTKRHGERFNDALREHMARVLTKEGCKAVAPANSQFFEKVSDEEVGRASKWSERHAAYAAGLGTFSLSDGFITKKGVAMRCGSLVADLKIAPTERKYRSHLDNCLFYSGGSCTACISRCPAGAITEGGHDKVKCRNYTNKVAADYTRKNYGTEVKCCGLCQTAVPCEDRIP